MSTQLNNITIKILFSPLSDIVEIYQEFIKKNHSRALSMMVGYIDSYNKNKAVRGLTYEMHTALAEKTLRDIAHEAKKHFDNNAAIYISCTTGYIPAGEVCTLVMVSASSFKLAHDMAGYIINEIKKRLPRWKQENYFDGSNQYLAGNFTLKK